MPNPSEEIVPDDLHGDPEDPIAILKALRDSLPVGHHELPGVTRAIEVLTYD
jgi:hypothetical protein